ncbi:MAG: hypothetical protein KKD17_02080 [Nanoarchaeota archaeon]|nr:hypothetical protein [Nanoarchaeota archaeon]
MKKISPLLATMMLLAFSLSLSMVVMKYSAKFMPEHEEPAEDISKLKMQFLNDEITAFEYEERKKALEEGYGNY